MVQASTRVDQKYSEIGMNTGSMPNASAAACDYSRRGFLGSFISSLTGIGILGSSALGAPNARRYPLGAKLQPGDIIFVDSGSAIQGGFVVKVDPVSGEKIVLSSGGLLRMPYGVAIQSDGQLIVSDSGLLIRINPETTAQTLIADNTTGDLGQPYGVAVEHHNSIVVANLRDILRITPGGNHLEKVYSGGSLRTPLGVAVTTGNDLIVLNRASTPEIVRARANGEQVMVSRGGLLKAPQAIAVANEQIFVTDVATADGNFGVGRIIQINGQSGEQSIVAEGEYLSGPVGIAAMENGELVIGDPYATRLETPDRFDGGILRINPSTHKQTLLTSGEGAFVNPRGVAIVSNA